MPRIRQVRSVIMERREDDKRRDVDYLSRMVRQITSVQASTSGAKSKDMKGIDKFDLWDGAPDRKAAERLPSTSKVLSTFGGGREMISWDQVQARAAQRKAG